MSSGFESEEEQEQVESSLGVVGQILEELVTGAVESSYQHQLESLTLTSLTSEREAGRGEERLSVQPLHSHLLLYCGQVDTRAALHSLACLADIVAVHPRLAVSCLATTSVASPALARSPSLVHLLARHRRAVLGRAFSSSLPHDATAAYRSSMLVEVVVSLCLYYLRSYYPALPGLGEQEVRGNRELQLAAVGLLAQVLRLLLLSLLSSGDQRACLGGEGQRAKFLAVHGGPADEVQGAEGGAAQPAGRGARDRGWGGGLHTGGPRLQ